MMNDGDGPRSELHCRNGGGGVGANDERGVESGVRHGEKDLSASGLVNFGLGPKL